MIAPSSSSSSSAPSSSSSSSSSSAPTTISAIQSFLQAPLSRLRCWYPGFSLDSARDVGVLGLVALPDTQRQALLARAARADSGQGLLDLAQRRQPIPNRISLAAEHKGKHATSTNHGLGGAAVKLEQSLAAAPAAAVVASSSSSSTAAAASSSSVASHKHLSVLSPELVSQFRANLARSQAASVSLHGDPVARERLRALLRLKALYESVSFRLRSENRPNMPLAELAKKLLAGAQGDWTDEAALLVALRLLVSVLPRWCSIGSSGSPAREVFRSAPGGARACIDPSTGQDKNILAIDRAVRECEHKLMADAAAASAGPNTAATPAAAAAATATAAAMEEDEISIVRVKIEAQQLGSRSMSDVAAPTSAAAAASSASAAAAAAAAEADAEIKVKQEFPTQTPAALAASASSLAQRATSRLLLTPSKSSSASPAGSKSHLSARASMLAKASKLAAASSSSASSNKGASAAPVPKPTPAGSLAAKLSNMR